MKKLNPLCTARPLNDPWLLNFDIAYDSKFQEGSNVSPLLPVSDSWRFGMGAQHQVSKAFFWAVAAEYQYGGTLDVDLQTARPVALSGRGNVEGSYDNTSNIFFSLYGNWTF